MRNLLLFTALIMSVALVLGCPGGKLATNKVSGTVTYEGKPLSNATVNFTPAVPGKGHPAYGLTDEEGKYLLQTILGNADAGTTPGDYLVYIQRMEDTEPTDSGLNGPSSAVTFRPPPKSLIPERYNSTATSGLTATVTNKKNNVINFDLVP